MSQARSIATSEEQETPTFPNLTQAFIEDTQTFSMNQKMKAVFANKDNQPQEIQQDTQLVQQKLKTCIFPNFVVDQKVEEGFLQKFRSCQQYYFLREPGLLTGTKKMNNQPLINDRICQSQKNEQSNFKVKTINNPQLQVSKQNKLQKKQIKSNIDKDNKQKDEAFWKYIIHDKDPRMKRTIIKPCRFWMGQHVQYCKKGRIIKRVRRDIAQIIINPYDINAVLSSNTDILSQSITKGSITIKPKAHLRLNSVDKIMMTLEKDYSFNKEQSILTIVQTKGKNRIFLSKNYNYTIINALKKDCVIDCKVYLNV